MKDSTFIKIGIVFLLLGVGAFVLVTKPWIYFSNTSQNSEKTPEISQQEVVLQAPEKTLLPSPEPSISPEPENQDFLAAAQNFMQQGEYQKAIKTIEKHQNKNPQSIKAFQLSIDASMGMMDYFRAEKEINALLKLQNTPQNQVKKVEILMLAGKANDAKKLINTLPQSAEKIFYQMLIAVTEEKWEEVKTHANQLIKSQSSYGQTAQNFLDIFENYKSFRDGSPHYLRTMMANMLNILDYHALTIQFIKPTLEEYPDYRDAWILMGNSYLALKKFKIAEEMLDKAVSLDPAHPQSPFFLAVTLAELKQYDEAKNQFQNAIYNGYEPKAKAYRYMADLYAREKNYDKAVEFYQEAISDGENAIPRDYIDSITISLIKLNSPDLALKTATQFNTKFPEEKRALPFLAWSLLKTGKAAKAEQVLQKAISQYPNLADSQLFLGEALSAQNKNEQALNAYKKGYELGKGNAVSRECAQKYNDLKTQLSGE